MLFVVHVTLSFLCVAERGEVEESALYMHDILYKLQKDAETNVRSCHCDRSAKMINVHKWLRLF